MKKRKFTFTIGKEWNSESGFEDINEGMTTKTARSVQAFLKKTRPLDCKGTWGEMVDSPFQRVGGLFGISTGLPL